MRFFAFIAFVGLLRSFRFIEFLAFVVLIEFLGFVSFYVWASSRDTLLSWKVGVELCLPSRTILQIQPYQHTPDPGLEVALEFRGWGFRYEEKLYKLPVAPTGKSLRNISHNRRGRSPNLIDQTMVVFELPIARNVINAINDFPCFLPTS